MGWYVEHDGQQIAEGTSDGRVTTMSGGDRDRFQINWSAGDEIRIVLRAGN